MKHLLRRSVIFSILFALPTILSAQSYTSPLECRLTLSPFGFECLNADEIKKEQKIRENVFVPESQVEVFKNLEKKEQDIQRQSELQSERSNELRALEERIENKLNDLKLERERYEGLRQEKIKIDEENIAKLVSYYEKMDPENASAFFNQMDLNTASQIILRMNPRKVSRVLEILDVDRAVAITEQVAGFKKNLSEAASLEDPNRDIPNTNLPNPGG